MRHLQKNVKVCLAIPYVTETSKCPVIWGSIQLLTKVKGSLDQYSLTTWREEEEEKSLLSKDAAYSEATF